MIGTVQCRESVSPPIPLSFGARRGLEVVAHTKFTFEQNAELDSAQIKALRRKREHRAVREVILYVFRAREGPVQAQVQLILSCAMMLFSTRKRAYTFAEAQAICADHKGKLHEEDSTRMNFALNAIQNYNKRFFVNANRNHFSIRRRTVC